MSNLAPADPAAPTPPEGAGPPAYRFKAFISYNHAADGELSEQLQRGLEWFARPFYRGRAFRIFRDRTNLSANPDLWQGIRGALGQSEYYIYLATPRAAQSKWVRKELDYWFRNREMSKALIVLSEGKLAWDAASSDFDWSQTDAMPDAVKGLVRSEPLWLDLAWVRNAPKFDPRDPRFQDAVATLASPLNGQDKDALYGEHLRLQRHARSQRRAAFVALAILLLASMGFAAAFYVFFREAEQRALIATSGKLGSQAGAEVDRRLDRSLLLGASALRTYDTFEARAALFRSLTNRPGLSKFLHATERPIVYLAFSPGGQTLIGSSGSPGTQGHLLSWDLRKPGSPARVVANYPTPGAVRFALHPTEKTLALGLALGKGLFLSDYDDARLRNERELTIGGKRLNAWTFLAFSPDGRTLVGQVAVPGSGPVLAFWDLATKDWSNPRTIQAPNAGFTSPSLAFTPDGRMLAVGIPDVRVGVRLWDMAAWRWAPDDLLAVPEGPVDSIAISPDGTTLAACYASPMTGSGLIFWDLATHRRQAPSPIKVPEGSARHVRFNHDGSRLALAYSILAEQSRGGAVLWDVASKARVVEEPLVISEGSVGDLAFAPDGKTLAVSFEEGATLWDMEKLKEWTPPKGDGIQDIVDTGTRTLALGWSAQKTSLAIWDLGTRKKAAEVPVDLRGGYLGMAILAPNGEALAAILRPAKAGPAILSWRTSSPASPIELKVPGEIANVDEVAFLDGHATLTASMTIRRGQEMIPCVVRWDVGARAEPPPEVLTLPGGEIAGASFRPDGKILAYHSRIKKAQSDRGRVTLWDVSRKQPLGDFEFGDPGSNVRCHTFSPDGSILAIGGMRRMELWDVAGRKRLIAGRHDVPEGTIAGLEFSSNGRILAGKLNREAYGAQFGGGVILWDVESGMRLTARPLKVPVGILIRLRFSPDNRALLGNTYHEALRWPIVPTDALIGKAREIANRNLSWAEWQEYFPGEDYNATFPELGEGPGVREMLKAGGEGFIPKP